MRQNTKYNLKNIFGSTVSNQCAIDAARTLPWWSAIICLILGVLLPLIPIVVSVANTNGQSYITGTNYGYDRDITSALVQLHNEKKTLVVDEEKYLHYYVDGEEQLPNTTADLEPITKYVNTKENQYELLCYFTRRGTNDEPSLNDLYKKVTSTKYVKGTMNVATTEEDKDCYIPSILVFHSEGLASALFKHNSVTGVTSTYAGDFKCTESGKDLVTRLLTVSGEDIPTEVNSIEYINGVFANVKEFYNECFTATKNRMFLMNTTIYFGVYAGLVILLGLLIFALTRGRNNPNRYLKWYHCQFIMYWACFAPGLLAMIFGFLLSSYAMMFFIIFMGLRAMWISMKQLSANYQQAA